MSKPKDLPKQEQKKQPGEEQKMHPEPEIIRDGYKGSEKLKGKVALITGGDSGIGRSVAVHFATEGAKVAIVYLNEDEDALETKKMVEKAGSECLLLEGDLKDEKFCKKVVQDTVKEFGKLNILVNNAAMQFPKEEPEEVSAGQVRKTFETNIFPYFFTVNEALKHLKEGDTIINTTSVTAYRGSEHLLDYSSTKGAITSFTRSLSKMLADRNIRVNGVAPGPIWTPLIPATFDEKHISEFGKKVPLGRAGQPSEVGPAYVYLACDDSSYVTGQIIHVNGGEVVGA
ncbi:NAD(P)-dependent dehydrogenase, short-chain alcohol dehydrogenase family [Salinimicrobium catena]|uniref:NAD(P)-dependent dehydrogenase, short-chain alcohol dehydrogenase family n=1 Tax=Salinimicrobium catena TaxID=390640 RepID=A0A1H5JWI9_9FLAO|nr:SDR family oxidoreductase [Salinimicrobium catena]SDK90683.1 NAD(P)-dependent dehydrogenase, short-chain alcohol dehydrogenase family [Salinimicrobium catena]SEE56261.1 NAD(P)-dependent dehydrogenase, short-chain alcohol dehydrogenase family [Salinimicrobium catena]